VNCDEDGCRTKMDGGISQRSYMKMGSPMNMKTCFTDKDESMRWRRG
jgi:hypothetical protein